MQENTIKGATGGGSSAASATSTTTVPSVTSPSNANDIDQAQFEADKRAVYKHPLFSLLALLLEKCEQATQGYVSSSSNSNRSSPNGSSNGGNDGDSFSRDIQAFVQMLEKEKRPLLTNNPELDGLMIKALQVLRIHLLELEKVQELCRDFCTRYIACLRGKMQSENLLRSDYALEHNNNLSNSNSPINSPEQVGQENLSGSHTYYNANEYNIPNTDTPTDFSNVHTTQSVPTAPNGSFPTQQPHNGNPQTQLENSAENLGLGLHSTIQSQQLPLISQQSTQILGSTPLSQIGCPPLPSVDQFTGQLSPCGSSDELDSGDDDLGSNFSSNSGSKRQKRGILPKHATSVMRAWLFQHLVHPYPTEDEKRAIAAQTNLTLLQVNNWFINARRRILQPMLEHATDSNTGGIDPNIENISANVNRADRCQSSTGSGTYNYSSDESNDSLVIDQDN